MPPFINLAIAAGYELDFLKELDRYIILDDPNVVKISAWRYEHLWLPLLSQISQDHTQDLEYLPLFDVHWIWHVHMLSPSHYTRDCKKNFGRIFNHELFSLEDMMEKCDHTKQVWEKAYPGHPFHLPSTPEEIIKIYSDLLHSCASTSLRYDIRAASHRQRSFFYNVSLPHYWNQDFLSQALQRYEKFLYLKKKRGSLFLVPCYDIDLIWHTHQVHPLIYTDDCLEILGHLLPHDDTDADRSEGSKLDTFFRRTADYWQMHYQEPYSKPGAM